MTYRPIVLTTCIALLMAGCGKSEAEKKIETIAANNAEINLHNVAGIMDYCAGKGYLDRKLVDKTRQDFATDLDADTAKLADQAFQQGRKGNLMLRMNRRAKEGEAGDGAAKPADTNIDVAFTRKEQQNGELSVFCKRTELWAARETIAAAKARNQAKSNDKKPESNTQAATAAKTAQQLGKTAKSLLNMGAR